MKSGDSDRLGQLVDEGIDCYAILGLPSDRPNTRSVDITFQYNRLMAQGGMTEDKRKIINDAASILRDPDLRKKHDNALGHDELNASIKVPTMYEGIGTQNQTRTGEVVDKKQAEREHLEKKAGIHAKMIQSGKYKQFGFVDKARSSEMVKTSSRDGQAVAPQQAIQRSDKPLTRMEQQAKKTRRAQSTGSIPGTKTKDERKIKSSDGVPSQEAIDYVSLIKADRDEHRQKMAEKAEKSSLRTWFTGRDKDGLTKNERIALKYLQEQKGNKTDQKVVNTVLQSVRSGKIKPSGRSM